MIQDVLDGSRICSLHGFDIVAGEAGLTKDNGEQRLQHGLSEVTSKLFVIDPNPRPALSLTLDTVDSTAKRQKYLLPLGDDVLRMQD